MTNCAHDWKSWKIRDANAEAGAEQAGLHICGVPMA